MKGPKALLLTVGMAAVMLALLVVLRRQYPRLAAAHWRGQLETVPDESAGVLLRQVAELGEPGIPVLVEALGSERASVAGAGREVLWEQLDQWQMLAPAASSPRLAVLARALAEHAERFGPTARSDAADLATRILLWPLDAETVDRGEVIASCERVFRATSAPGGAVFDGDLALRRPGAVEPGATGTRQRRPGMADDPTDLGPSLVELSRLPGGGLPIDSFPEPSVSGAAGHTLVGDARAARPRRLPVPPAARPLSPGQQLDGPSAGLEQRQGASDSGHAAEHPRAPEPNTVRILSLSQGDAPLSGSPEGFSGTDTVELMRWLRDRGTSRASEARAELIRRGFSEVHLELARRLVDPDPEVRKRLARALPAMQSVDAAPWLLWLARDEDPEVRRVAVGLMATTNDAALLEQVEKVARGDPDPQVRRQAERLARGRGRQSR